MVIVVPCYVGYSAVARISLGLLERYWVGHPRVVEVRMSGAGWVGEMVGAVERLEEELFILMLEDYGMCGAARTEGIALALGVMEREAGIGMIPLCWYPARDRVGEVGLGGELVRLVGAPVLLQAAIWRREWFLELARGMDPRASAWGFEAGATRKIRGDSSSRICGFAGEEPVWRGGMFLDGFEKSEWVVPYHNLMHRGKPALEYEGFLREHAFAFPSRGLGDSFAKVVEATGLGAVAHGVEKVTGRPCGCAERREWLNEKVRYGGF